MFKVGQTVIRTKTENELLQLIPAGTRGKVCFVTQDTVGVAWPLFATVTYSKNGIRKFVRIALNKPDPATESRNS